MSIPLPVQAAGALAASAAVYYYQQKQKESKQLPLPPGPQRWPIIGSWPIMPKELDWQTFHQWSKEQNTDILHIDAMGNHIIVLDTPELANELLEKRSSIYSGRPRMVMMNELMGWTFNFGFQDYGDWWRQHRKMMHQSFHPQAALKFRPHELRACHNLLRQLAEDPSNLIRHLRTMAGETVIRIAYGLPCLERDDPYVAVAEKAVMPMFVAAIPGNFLVDHLPILKRIPEWIPGTFKHKAKDWKEWALNMLNDPYADAKKLIESGNFEPSFIADSLESLDPKSKDFEKQEYIIKSVAGTMFTAGADTTVAAIASCVLGLLEHPEILAKAQKQIDEVCGMAVPSFDHYDSLPYIHAITKETLRWRDVLPMALPHRLEVDDEYRGYRLPKGSIVFGNAWAMLHDPEVYPEPFEFIPERFMLKDGSGLDPDAKDPEFACFGFGRRVCPGRYMAYSAVWIAIAQLIGVFDLRKAKDENGNIIHPKHEYQATLLNIPLPFPCSITPRSKEHEALIRQTVNEVYYE